MDPSKLLRARNDGKFEWNTTRCILPVAYRRICNGNLGLWLAEFFKAWDKWLYPASHYLPIIKTAVCLGKNTSKYHFVMALLWRRHSRRWKTVICKEPLKTVMKLYSSDTKGVNKASQLRGDNICTSAGQFVHKECRLNTATKTELWHIIPNVKTKLSGTPEPVNQFLLCWTLSVLQ